MKFQGSSASSLKWVLLAAFSQIYSENQEQKGGLCDLKNLQLVQKGSTCKVGVVDSMVSENISIKKKLSALHQDSGKYGLKAY